MTRRTFPRRCQPAPVETGTLAFRIADMLERFGVNTFSSTLPDSNAWGSWPADYSPASVVAALKWLTGASGLTIQGREYHYASGRDWQSDWCAEVHAATGARFTLAVGANGGAGDADSLTAMGAAAPEWLAWVENVNEPNTNFGSGTVPPDVVVAIQASMKQGVAASVQVAGPSVVFGLPFPEGYIGPGYATQAQIAAIVANASLANAHVYPPTEVDLDDGSGRGGAFRDITQGLRAVYGALPLMVTEWHPTLYNAEGHSLSPVHDAYYAPCFFLSAFRENVVGWWWYALFDYGEVYLSGLFPKTGGVDPRPVAHTIRAMFTLTGDTGADKRTFAPGRLTYTVTGLPAAPPEAPNSRGQHMLFQNSAGKYFLFVWDAQSAPEGSTVPVTISFATPPASVTDYKISDASSPDAPTSARQIVKSGSSIVVDLDASVHLLVIEK